VLRRTCPEPVGVLAVQAQVPRVAPDRRNQGNDPRQFAVRPLTSDMRMPARGGHAMPAAAGAMHRMSRTLDRCHARGYDSAVSRRKSLK
jgi:hypothetical protein